MRRPTRQPAISCYPLPVLQPARARLPAALLAALLLTGTGAAQEPTPTVAPQPAPLLSAEALEPGGGKVPLSADSEAIIDPASTFRVVLPGRSDDARLSLLDAASMLVPGTAAREVGEQTILTIAPVKPLTPASRYLLRIDGTRERHLHDAAGRAAGPVELPMVVAGSPPEPPRKAAKRRRR
jgi:hypothetical protein